MKLRLFKRAAWGVCLRQMKFFINPNDSLCRLPDQIHRAHGGPVFFCHNSTYRNILWEEEKEQPIFYWKQFYRKSFLLIQKKKNAPFLYILPVLTKGLSKIMFRKGIYLFGTLACCQNPDTFTVSFVPRSDSENPLIRLIGFPVQNQLKPKTRGRLFLLFSPPKNGLIPPVRGQRRDGPAAGRALRFRSALAAGTGRFLQSQLTPPRGPRPFLNVPSALSPPFRPRLRWSRLAGDAPPPPSSPARCRGRRPWCWRDSARPATPGPRPPARPGPARPGYPGPARRASAPPALGPSRHRSWCLRVIWRQGGRCQRASGRELVQNSVPAPKLTVLWRHRMG